MPCTTTVNLNILQVGSLHGWRCQISVIRRRRRYIFTAGVRLSRGHTLVTPAQCAGKYNTHTHHYLSWTKHQY